MDAALETGTQGLADVAGSARTADRNSRRAAVATATAAALTGEASTQAAILSTGALGRFTVIHDEASAAVLPPLKADQKEV